MKLLCIATEKMRFFDEAKNIMNCITSLIIVWKIFLLSDSLLLFVWFWELKTGT